MYMDDLKLYAKKSADLDSLLDKTTTFSKDIGMYFGLDKCRKLNIEKDRILEGNYLTNTEEVIEAMKDEELYK